MTRFVIKLQRRDEKKFLIALKKLISSAFLEVGDYFAINKNTHIPVYLKEDIKRDFKLEIKQRRLNTANAIKNYLLKKGKNINKEEDLNLLALALNIEEYNDKASFVESAYVYTRFEHIVNKVIASRFPEEINYEDIPTLFRQLEGGLFNGTSRFMARNATADALSHANLLSAKEVAREYGLTLKKVWVSTEDSRVRPTHKKANGQTVPIDEAFLVGGYRLQRPNDNLGHRSETVNCRCVMIYR